MWLDGLALIGQRTGGGSATLGQTVHFLRWENNLSTLGGKVRGKMSQGQSITEINCQWTKMLETFVQVRMLRCRFVGRCNVGKKYRPI
jgi:hypothetical protein